MGFILAYRAGWILSVATATSLIVTTFALVPVGILLYKEELSFAQILGILLCTAGVLLLQIKK